MMKGALRSIYHMAKNDFQAEAAFKNWCSIARKTEINELTAMAKTIENNISGIIAYWKTDALSKCRRCVFNLSFNDKLRQSIFRLN